MQFTKMHGLGNDYIYIDCFKRPAPKDPAALSRRLSPRHFAVGSDGLILIEPTDLADASMRIFNADGSEAEMCGNGLRCVGKYLYDAGIAKKEQLTILTKSGVKALSLEIREGVCTGASADMGEPELLLVKETLRAQGENVTITAVGIGNPHAVVFMDELPGDGKFFRLGSAIEHHERFPNRINVEFVQVTALDELHVRVWERGSGETLACGSGACASLVAAARNGLCNRKAKVLLKGGALLIEWRESDNHVYMTGPAETAFTGEFEE